MEEKRTDYERYAPKGTEEVLHLDRNEKKAEQPVTVHQEVQAVESETTETPLAPHLMENGIKNSIESVTATTVAEKTMKEVPHDGLYIAARVLSAIFSPFWTPFIGFVLLFFCTYLSIMPAAYKTTVLSLVFCFTVLLPIIGIFCYQKINGWGIKELSERKKRFIPYLFTIMSYVGGILTMYRIHFPKYMSGILLAALICMLLCTLINTKWKISTHTASIGMMVGGLLSYSFLFQFNPIGPLYIFILLSGLLGSARIIVCQHTLNEVVGGFFVGLFCGIIGILFI